MGRTCMGNDKKTDRPASGDKAAKPETPAKSETPTAALTPAEKRVVDRGLQQYLSSGPDF